VSESPSAAFWRPPFEHLAGDVDSDDVGTLVREHRREPAGAAGDLEYAVSLLDRSERREDCFLLALIDELPAA